MSVVVRSWALSVLVIVAGGLLYGALAVTTDLPQWVLNVIIWTVLGLSAAVAGRWCLRRRPDAGVVPYTVATVGFPVLYSVYVTFSRRHYGAETGDLARSAIVDVLVLTAVAVLVWRYGRVHRPVGYR